MRGRGKGSQYERDVARQLSLWWTDDRNDAIFWRTSQSGGRAKTRMKTGRKTFGQYGDIQATDPSGRQLLDLLTIELKKGYNREPAFNAIDRPRRFRPSVWEGFLLQATTDAQNAGTPYWMLIHKRDAREAVVFIPRILYERLRPNAEHCRPVVRLITHQGIDVWGTTLTSFLEWIDPSDIARVRVAKASIHKRT